MNPFVYGREGHISLRMGVLSSFNMAGARDKQVQRKRRKRSEGLAEEERKRAALERKELSRSQYIESSRDLLEMETEEAISVELASHRALSSRLTQAALELERAKVRRLEIARSGNAVIAAAAGFAVLGGLLGATGAAAGALAGGLFMLAFQLASRHN